MLHQGLPLILKKLPDDSRAKNRTNNEQQHRQDPLRLGPEPTRCWPPITTPNGACPSATAARCGKSSALDGFQAGLSWLTILRKRDAFRKAFKGFVPEKIVKFTEADVERLMQDAGIVRSRSKIEATIGNARLPRDAGGGRRFLRLHLGHGGRQAHRQPHRQRAGEDATVGGYFRSAQKRGFGSWALSSSTRGCRPQASWTTTRTTATGTAPNTNPSPNEKTGRCFRRSGFLLTCD